MTKTKTNEKKLKHTNKRNNRKLPKTRKHTIHKLFPLKPKIEDKDLCCAIRFYDNFDEMIKQFKAESIEETVLENTNKVIAEHSDEFTSENMLQKSRAASYLCTYILNVIVFNTIYKKVKPLVEAKDRATDELAEKQKILAGVKEVVRQINEKVSALKRQLEEAEKEKQRVENDANLCQAKLHAAEKLVIGLAGENKRWGENVVILKENTLS